MANLKSFGIDTNKVITVKKFRKGEAKTKWLCINILDNAKVNGEYKTLGKFCIWVSNEEVIDQIQNGTDIKLKSIDKIYFTQNTYTSNGKTYTDVTVNVNAIVEIISSVDTQNPYEEYDNTPTQDYSFNSYNNDEFDLPNF